MKPRDMPLVPFVFRCDRYTARDGITRELNVVLAPVGFKRFYNTENQHSLVEWGCSYGRSCFNVECRYARGHLQGSPASDR